MNAPSSRFTCRIHIHQVGRKDSCDLHRLGEKTVSAKKLTWDLMETDSIKKLFCESANERGTFQDEFRVGLQMTNSVAKLQVKPFEHKEKCNG